MSVKLFYVDFEDGGDNFFKEAQNFTMTSNAQKHNRVNVFHKKDCQGALYISHMECIVKYPSSTYGPDASWVSLVSTLTVDKKLVSRPNVTLYLVSAHEKRLTELIALLKITHATTVNTGSVSFVDCFDSVCKLCKIIFKDDTEKEGHDRMNHLLLCDNSHCERSKRGNGFLNKVELDEHIAKQRKCDICTSGASAGLKFCSVAKRDDHMRTAHVRRVNGIRSASVLDGRSEDHVLHFRYSLCPLPCFAETTCVQRFRTLSEQVLHHVTWHGSKFPYVCMACVSTYAQPVRLGTKSALIEHAKLMAHAQHEVFLQ
ncbi:uncharacterized protein LOC116612108 [Nematostella vectensis]|uniref:uncharacterized protein LOC116612108 n=1 Tax=Nematostella vectensis TaxID=45351 RepID=UPI0013905C9C|nr:uncharacterized protein LOC116612108 [Nematostella vectensis]